LRQEKLGDKPSFSATSKRSTLLRTHTRARPREPIGILSYQGADVFLFSEISKSRQNNRGDFDADRSACAVLWSMKKPGVQPGW
jgi:hypothetical protein